MSMPPLALDVAGRFKEKVLRACGEHVLAIRVFGSMARGDFRDDSDLDVFVLLDEKQPELVDAIGTAAWQAAFETEFTSTVSPLIMSRAHFDELVRRERRIALDILAEGVLV